jgi:hypothetical protein
MMRKILRSMLVLGFIGMLWSCEYRGAEYYDDYDIVYTNYDQQFTYTGHKNYFIPNVIPKITGSFIEGDAPEFVNSAYATQMLDRMKSNMTAMGYTLVANVTSADVVLVPAAVEVTNISYYYDYWYDYYWGWYGGYYPYPITYSYKTGSLFMELVDPTEESANGKKRVIWTGIVNGLLEGSSANFSARMNKSIDQAFDQSEYLHQ